MRAAIIAKSFRHHLLAMMPHRQGTRAIRAARRMVAMGKMGAMGKMDAMGKTAKTGAMARMATMMGAGMAKAATMLASPCDSCGWAA